MRVMEYKEVIFGRSSVGSLCELIAYHQLVDVARVRLRSLRPGFLGNIDFGGMPFPEWRKARAGKVLYELQIEVSEMALRIAQTEGDVSEVARIATCGKLESQITVLRQTKQAVFERFPMGLYDFYNAESAQEMRGELEEDELEGAR